MAGWKGRQGGKCPLKRKPLGGDEGAMEKLYHTLPPAPFPPPTAAVPSLVEEEEGKHLFFGGLE